MEAALKCWEELLIINPSHSIALERKAKLLSLFGKPEVNQRERKREKERERERERK